jgi:hypothetical protein
MYIHTYINLLPSPPIYTHTYIHTYIQYIPIDLKLLQNSEYDDMPRNGERKERRPEPSSAFNAFFALRRMKSRSVVFVEVVVVVVLVEGGVALFVSW